MRVMSIKDFDLSSVNFVPANSLWRAVLYRYEVMGLFPPLNNNLAHEMYRVLDGVPFVGRPYICSIIVVSDDEAYLTYATTNFVDTAEFNHDLKWVCEVRNAWEKGEEMPKVYPYTLSQHIHQETQRITTQHIRRLRYEMQTINTLKISNSGEPCARDGHYGYGQMINGGQLHHFEVEGCPQASEEQSWKDEHIRFFRAIYDVAKDSLETDIIKEQMKLLNSWFYGFHRPDKN